MAPQERVATLIPRINADIRPLTAPPSRSFAEKHSTLGGSLNLPAPTVALGAGVKFTVIPVKTGIQMPPNHENTFEMPNCGFRPVSENPEYRGTLLRRNDEIKVRKDGSLILSTPLIEIIVAK